ASATAPRSVAAAGRRRRRLAGQRHRKRTRQRVCTTWHVTSRREHTPLRSLFHHLSDNHSNKKYLLSLVQRVAGLMPSLPRHVLTKQATRILNTVDLNATVARIIC